jgi:hypothetical protein
MNVILETEKMKRPGQTCRPGLRKMAGAFEKPATTSAAMFSVPDRSAARERPDSVARDDNSERARARTS